MRRGVLVAMLGAMLLPSAAHATTYYYRANADARVRANTPTTNDGTLGYLATNGWSGDLQESFLRFRVARLDGPVVSAVLRGHSDDTADAATANGPAVYPTTGAWTESGLTWSNRPAATGPALADVGAVGRNAWFNLPVTPAVPGIGTFNFVLRQSTGDPLYFHSREFPTTSEGPRLIVTTKPSPPQYPLRGTFFRQTDGGYDVIASKGFNLIDSGPGEVDALAGGLRGLTWVGDYDKNNCTWQKSDAEIRSDVQAHVGDPKVGVWFIADEPWIGGTPHCANAPAQVKARSALIHSIDPQAKTLMVVDSNSGQESLDQIPAWKGATDYVALNPYMCWQGRPCHYEWIDRLAQTADSAGLPYWGVVQAYGDPTGQGQEMCTTTSEPACGEARLPTAAEIHQEFLHWRATAMHNYLVFSWHWPDDDSLLWLQNHPELQDQLAAENAPQTATPAPTATPTPTPSTGDPVVAVAGDIADDGNGDSGTAQVVQRINPDRVLTVGDGAYPDGALADYKSWYDPTWGAFKAKTRPAPGNHDYHTSGAPGYFDYFDGAGVASGPAGDRGKGYYSFDLGSWHLIALNNYVPMSAGSAQETWLKADLAAHPGCTLAYWHEPRFTSGAEHANSTSTAPLWNDLYAAGADVVVNGHNHQYERFARQNPQGGADPANGIREFVAGTGGAGLYSFGTIQPNSEVRNGITHGVLKLTLHPSSYEWQFVPSDGTFADSGSTAC
jgi:hypothetical protein